MKNQTRHKPAAGKFPLLRQLCNFIPPHLVPRLARETGVEDQARTFSPWSHVVSLLYAQLTHSLGLNDVCDALRLHSGSLSALRGAAPPPKNTRSHANRRRDPKMAGQFFWAVLEHLQTLQPTFGGNRRPKSAFRFKRLIHVVDSTTIQLMARSLDWARHRRRKAAAKCHVRLDLQTFLPRCAIVATASEHDNRRARRLCANVQAGEIVVFDKACPGFAHLAGLSQRGVFWAARAKDNLQCRVVRKFQDGLDGNILRDDLIVPANPAVQALYPVELRRVTAPVEVDGQRREMVFLTNNLAWSAQTIADLHRCRWSIGVFFKELKQTLQLAGFPGHNANAVKWQVWTALPAHVLLRFCAHLGQWSHSFTRLFALIRPAPWQNWEPRSLLEVCGTAGGGGRFLGTPQQACLAGFG
jgi:hypothetical protein